MNESSNKRTVIVGVFILTGLIFLIAGILMVGNLHDTFKKKMKVVSLFEDVSGLQTGNNVWFSGVKVGTVSNIHFYGKSQVVVSLKIETNAQNFIRKDAKVKISTDGLIGNKILVIYGGSAIARQVEEGDTLGVEKTFSSDDMLNTLQENNKNILAITNDFKIISKKIAAGEGTLGKLLNQDDIYENIYATTNSLRLASSKTQHVIQSLDNFTQGLNKKGSLANDLINDTLVFKSISNSVFQLQKIADTANAFITNLKEASANPKTPVGVLLYDEQSGAHLKKLIKNLELSSQKLDEDLEAAQHNFLLRRYFKKKAKSAKADSLKIK